MKSIKTLLEKWFLIIYSKFFIALLVELKYDKDSLLFVKRFYKYKIYLIDKNSKIKFIFEKIKNNNRNIYFSYCFIEIIYIDSFQVKALNITLFNRFFSILYTK